MITWQEAQEIVAAHVRPLETESRHLAEAAGYCLAEEIRADRDFPPTDRSAMDGFAVRASDTASAPCFLPLLGEARAGRPYQGRPIADGCVRILTGAVVPDGADTIIRQENAVEENDGIKLEQAVKANLDIRKSGEEAGKGEVFGLPFSILEPVLVSLAAATGRESLKVYRQPEISVICTGSELTEPSAPVSPEKIRDSNGPLLTATFKRTFSSAPSCLLVEDEQKTVENALSQALEKHDAVILTGGVSVGKYDYVSAAVKNLGAKVHFHGVAIKPGKPQLYATIGDKQIFGLPGNPLAVLAGLHLFVLPALRRLAGYPPEKSKKKERLPVLCSARCRGKRTELRLGRRHDTPEGGQIEILDSRGSADLVAAAKADCFVILEPGQELNKYEAAELIPWLT